MAIKHGLYDIFERNLPQSSSVLRHKLLVFAAKTGDAYCLRRLLESDQYDEAFLNGALHQAILTGIRDNITTLRQAGASPQWCALDKAMTKLRRQPFTRSLSSIMDALA
jgi:hypothetical protein